MSEFALGFSVAALAKGVATTLIITVAGSLVAIVLGLIVGLIRVSSHSPLRWFGVAYIEFFRGTSTLVQLYWWFYVLPMFGVSLSPQSWVSA